MNAHRLRAVTWNVWFNDWHRVRRQQALWAELTAADPDVVCLQEVVPQHLAGPEILALRERGYWVSDPQIARYDVLLLTRLPVHSHERVRLPSIMGRELLVVRLATVPALTIATVHLESTKSMTERRCRQLAEINTALAGEHNVLLMGDMNFPDEPARPEAALLSAWTDVWPQHHPGDPGYTVDPEVNEMRAMLKPDNKQARIDRVFHRGGPWQVDAITRLGTRPFLAEPPLFISDHFGLQVDLVAR